MSIAAPDRAPPSARRRTKPPQAQDSAPGSGASRSAARRHIRLTNVTVLHSHCDQLLDSTPLHLPLLPELTLDPGQAVGFQGSFMPTPAESYAGSAVSTVTVRGTDITTMGGPNASVTNSMTVSSRICRTNPYLTAPAVVDGQFQLTVTCPAGMKYVIQASTKLGAANWLSLRTNVAPFTFVDSNAVLYPVRYYRAMLQP